MKKLSATITIFLFALSMTPVAFSADNAAALKECKSEAEKNEVDSGDMNTFLANCLAELDVAAADIKSLIGSEEEGGEKAKDD